jgi:hypothetical protein
MKISRSYLVTSIALIAFVTGANGFTLLGFFQSVEGGGSGVVSERKFRAQLKSQHDIFYTIDDVEEAKKHFKSLELNFTALGGGVDEGFQKTYGPVLMSYRSKPKEADERYSLIKKRELMEGLVKAYRKEIPVGPIPVRAAYLNILFDLQNSLVNQTLEAEAISLSKVRERFENLKFTGKSFRGDGLEERIAGLDGIFAAIEKGFEQRKKWKQERDRALSSAEASIGKLAKATIGSVEDGVEASRRFFLYSLIAGVSAFFLALALLYISHKFVKLKFEAKSDLFLKLLKEFGKEKLDPTYDRYRKRLLEDPDWGAITQGLIDSEKAFSDQYQALLSVPKSLLMPYVVFTKDRLAKHWNETAKTLFEIGDKRSTALDDIISERRVQGRDRADIIDLIRSTFTTSREDSFEVDIHQDGSTVPFEILCYPILSGGLAGGKIFFFRQIRSEAERVDKAVNGHLHIVREHVQAVLNGSLEEFNLQFAVHPDVRKTIEDLDSLRRKVSEKEILWKTEAGALIDQIDRQKDVLEKLNNQLKNIRDANKTAIVSFENRRGADEDLHSDICFLEKEIEQTCLYRTKLEEDLNMQNQLLNVARKYEVGVRASIGEMERFISDYIQLLNDLRGYCEEAKVQSVNLSFAKDPNSREYGARARAFAFELESFLNAASSIGERLKTIISQHPGSALAPHLDVKEADFSMLEGIKNEEERLASFVQRWKVSGESLIAESKKVSELAREIERVSIVATQLGETGLIINEQTHLNLERWN